MYPIRSLTLEVLNGPLDGAEIQITAETAWTKGLGGPLSFPWDNELGEPQAVITPSENGWFLVPNPSAQGIYRINTKEIIKEKFVLSTDDVLKAGCTWLLVKKVT